MPLDDEAKKQFQQIRAASETVGMQLRAGMQTAWEDMAGALSKPSSELRK